MRKRILSLVLAVLMLASALSITAFATDYAYGQKPAEGKSYEEGDTIWVQYYNELPGVGENYEWERTGQVKSELTCEKQEHRHDWNCYTRRGGHHGPPELTCGKQEHWHGDRCYTWLYQYKLVKKNAYQPGENEKLYVTIKNYDNSKDEKKFPNEPTCNDDFQYTFFNSSYIAHNYSKNNQMPEFAKGAEVAKYVDLNVFKAMNPATNTKKNQQVTVYGFYDANGINLAECAYMTDEGKKIIAGHETDMIQKFLNAQTTDSPYYGNGKDADDYDLLVYVVKYEENGHAPGWHIDCALVPKNNVKLIYDANYAPEAYRKNYADLPATVTANKSDKGTEVEVGELALAPSEGFTEASITNETTNEKLYFAGWNTAANGTGTWHAAKSKITLMNDNITLYAQWRSDEITIEKTVEGLPASYNQKQTYSFTATYQGTTTKTATIAVSGNTTTAATGTVTLNKNELDKPYEITETTPSDLTIGDDKYTCTVSYISESRSVNPGETLQVVNTWTKQEAPQPDLTVEKTATAYRYTLDEETNEVSGKTFTPSDDDPVRVGDVIVYTIEITNNTSEDIPAGNVTITDIFNGEGKLSLSEGAPQFAELENNNDGTYTITLTKPISAAASTTITLDYTVRYDDTVLGEDEGVKYLTNKAKVTYNREDYESDEVKIPVGTDTFNLVVEKYWETGSANVTVRLFKNGVSTEQKKTIQKEAHFGSNYTMFENLPLREGGKQIAYSVKETAIDGAGQPYADYTKFDVKDANGKAIGTWTASYADTIATNGHIRITNRYAPVDPITVTKTADKLTAKAGDTITYTIEITNNENANKTISFLDQLDTYGSLNFTGNYGFKIENPVAGSYKSEKFTIKEGETITLTAEYKVQVGDGKQVEGKEGYYVTNEITVYCNGGLYEDSASTKIEKDEDAYKIYVPIIKTLRNEGTDAFDGERFAFQIYTDYPNKMSHEWGHEIPSIDVGKVAAGDDKTEHYKNAGVDYYSFTMTQDDFDDLPIDENTKLPYVMIKERNKGTDKMTYDAKTYKLYLVPEKNSGSPQMLLMALLTGEEAALPSNPVYDPAETHTLYAIADLTKWKEDCSTPYDCAVEFVNYYDKQEHKGDTVKVGPQLNRDDHVAYIMGYPDGNVRPEGEITRAEACTIFFRLLTESSRDYYFSKTNDYTDVKAGEWYNNAISTLSSAGIVTGYNDGTFRPNQPITRGEMAKIIANFANLNKGAKSFTDLSGHWSKTYVELAAGNGWIAGYPDGSFRPDQKITRAETVTMINRVLERVPAKESRLLSRSIMLTFPDNNPGDWYYIAIQEASNSHEYQRSVYETAGDEMWTKLIENVDWTKLER